MVTTKVQVAIGKSKSIYCQWRRIIRMIIHKHNVYYRFKCSETPLRISSYAVASLRRHYGFCSWSVAALRMPHSRLRLYAGITRVCVREACARIERAACAVAERPTRPEREGRAKRVAQSIDRWGASDST